jgi:hypothetical protein
MDNRTDIKALLFYIGSASLLGNRQPESLPEVRPDIISG